MSLIFLRYTYAQWESIPFRICYVTCIRPTKARLQVACRISSGFNPSILQRSGIWGVADEAVLKNVHKKKKSKKSPLYQKARWKQKTVKNTKLKIGCLDTLWGQLLYICSFICKHKQTNSPLVEMVMVRPTLQCSNWAHTLVWLLAQHKQTWFHLSTHGSVYICLQLFLV